MKNEFATERLRTVLGVSYGDLPRAVTGVDWRLESAASGELVAYQLNSGPEALEKLRGRLSSAPPAILLLSSDPGVNLGVPVAVVKPGKWAEALGILCAHFYPIPRHIPLLAVTGTNGKTTTADLVLQLGEAAGKKGFSVGTLGVRQCGKTVEEFGLTTPGQLQLHRLLHRYGNDADFCIMEVSSHALDQERVAGLMFAAAAWTNITQDHLDYHGTMENYFTAKKKIFDYLRPGAKLFVPVSQLELFERLSDDPRTTPAARLADELQCQLPVFFRSRFNRDNLSCALSLVSALGIEGARLPLDQLAPPPGRFYTRAWANRVAIVDFAHTPDALENLLTAVVDAFPGRDVITLFGCGGDRDRTKRPRMGAIAEKFSQQVIVTSDNPRSEDPLRIIEDIAAGFKYPGKHRSCVDRAQAVREALAALAADQVLVLAGKGHEDGIMIGSKKIPYSDVEEVDRYIHSQEEMP